MYITEFSEREREKSSKRIDEKNDDAWWTESSFIFIDKLFIVDMASIKLSLASCFRLSNMFRKKLYNSFGFKII